MKVLETQRLLLRHLREDDAAFIFELVNDPSWLRFIGDKDVKSVAAARGYIARGPMAMYARLGFGLYLVALKSSGEALGICGLIKRDTLEDVDLGFAFLPRHWSQGYAREAGAATLDYGRRVLGLGRVVAITSPDNAASIRVLEKLDMRFQETVRLAGNDHEVNLFATP